MCPRWYCVSIYVCDCAFARRLGQKLRELLLKHGSFEQVEVEVLRYKKEEEENKLEGGWYNRITLEQEGWTPFPSCIILGAQYVFMNLAYIYVCIQIPQYMLYFHKSTPPCKTFASRQMIENSKAWAMARGLVEKSPIHGEEEWRIPLRRTFSHSEKSGSEVKQKATFEVQDRCSQLMVDCFLKIKCDFCTLCRPSFGNLN